MAKGRKRGARRPVVLFVASKDLLSEKLISACLVLSVVAVLTPILLLASVKVGFIDRLRQEFIEDPSFREIRPAEADLRSEDLFDEIRGWEGVRYVMPSIMLVPREVDYVAASGGAKDQARLLPSDVSDPLYDKLDGAPADGDTVVVTADIAETAGLRIGSRLDLVASRIENDRRQNVTLPVTVSGILPRELLPLPTILAHRDIDRQIESYRAGIAVPERGWAGVESVPKRTYEFIVVDRPDELGEILKSTLSVRVGARSVEPATGESLNALLGLSGSPIQLPGSDAFLLLTKGERGYATRDIDEANNVLRNAAAAAFGVNRPLSATALGKPMTVVGYEPDLMPEANVPGIDRVASLGDSYLLSSRALMPASLRQPWEAAGAPHELEVSYALGEGSETVSLTTALQVEGFADTPSAIVSSELLAMIARGRQVPLAFDATNRNLVEQSAGYRGFRVIGETIESIPQLVERFAQAGISVRARSDEILKLQRLERSLTILVWVVAMVALLGGYSILTSSFFSNVQRKQVDYATLRLVGMSKRLIFRIPLAQAAIVACLGFAVSVACYFVISIILNGFVAAELNFDGQLSKLYWTHFVFVGLFVIAGSCIASLAASREATSIDPAQALRGA